MSNYRFGLNRRGFLVLVGGACAGALIGTEFPALIRKPNLAPKLRLSVEGGYLVGEEDCYVELPSKAEYYGFDPLEPPPLDEFIDWYCCETGRDPDELAEEAQFVDAADVQRWLNSFIDPQEEELPISDREFAQFSPYGPGICLYDDLGHETARSLGLAYVEGDHPGSTFVGVAFDGDPKELTAALNRLGFAIEVV